MKTVAGLVLAAGESRRMGRDKALLPYRGRPFLGVILESLLRAGVTRRLVVLGHHAEVIRRSVNLEGVDVALNPDYRLGQTSSLKAGLRTLAEAGADGVLLCLVDHPAASPKVMRKLIGDFKCSSAPVVIPVCQGRSGHPVLIGRQLFPELLALDPAHGANTVTRKYRSRAREVDVDDPGILLDIDNPADFQSL